MELIVVVAIMAILAGGASVGRHSLADFIALQSATGAIETVIAGIRTDHLRDEYTKSSVYFMEEYLLADSKSHEAALVLKWEPVTTAGPDCEAGDIRLISSDEAILFVSDPWDGFLGFPAPLYGGDSLCFNPLAHTNTTTFFQLRSDRDFSNVIRFFPLNPGKGAASPVYLEPNDYRLDILMAFGKKKRYKNGVLLSDGDAASITVKVRESDATAVFDLPKN